MTNFAQNLFGVELSQLSAQTLNAYFAEQRLETDTLEFKSFPAQANFDPLFAKILKTICGFLNGSGGLLIWGAPVKTVVGEVDYFQGDLTPLAVQKSVDWFVNKISSSITPMPIEIAVKIITVEDSFVYLFEVQESKYKPHQVDHIYYIRLDGQTKPAPHYIVQALMRQITYPDLRAAIRINRFVIHAGQRIAKLAIVIFNFSQLQNEVDYNYNLTIAGGSEFLGWDTGQYGDQIRFNMNGAQLLHDPIPNPLHFGIPYIRTYQITIPVNVDELKIMLAFGGRHSPSKICFYTFNLRGVDIMNPQTSVTIEKDNELFEAKQTIEQSLEFFRNNEVI